jgi:hypothetical protein
MKLASDFLRTTFQNSRMGGSAFRDKNQPTTQARGATDAGPFRECQGGINLGGVQLIEKRQYRIALGRIPLPNPDSSAPSPLALRSFTLGRAAPPPKQPRSESLSGMRAKLSYFKIPVHSLFTSFVTI